MLTAHIFKPKYQRAASEDLQDQQNGILGEIVSGVEIFQNGFAD